MDVCKLIADLLPLCDAIVRATRDALGRGVNPRMLSDIIRDHFADLAAKLRAA